MQNWVIFQGESPPWTKDASIFAAMVVLVLFFPGKLFSITS